MARDLHEAVDFAPAWLNFNNSNKKKTEKTSGINSSSFSNFSFQSSKETSVSRPLSIKFNGSPSRSSPWGSDSSSGTGRTVGRHLSADFAPQYSGNRTEPIQSSVNEHRGYLRSTAPTFSTPRSIATTSRYARNDFSPFSTSDARTNTDSPLLSGRDSANRNGSRNSTRNGFSLFSMPKHSDDSRTDADFPSLSGRDSGDRIESRNFTRNGSSLFSTPKRYDDSRFGADFPLLSDKDTKSTNGPRNPEIQGSSGIGINMWQKPLVLKNKESEIVNHGSHGSTTMASNIYKTLVPKTSQQKPTYRRTVSVPSAFSSRTGGELPTNGRIRDSTANIACGKMLTGNTSSLRLAKSELQTPATVVSLDGEKLKSHANGSATENHEDNGKCASSIYLLGAADMHHNNCGTKDEPYYACQLKNGDLSSDAEEAESSEDSGLSRSLEAEHRLLLEMGWKHPSEQVPDEELPLTGDEIQEFQAKYHGVARAAPAQLEMLMQDALSTWKFTEIRKSLDADATDQSSGHEEHEISSENEEWQDSSSEDD